MTSLIPKSGPTLQDKFRAVIDYLQNPANAVAGADQTYNKQSIGRLTVRQDGMLKEFDFKARGLHITGCSYRGQGLTVNFARGDENGLTRVFDRVTASIRREQAAAAQTTRERAQSQKPLPGVVRISGGIYRDPSV